MTTPEALIAATLVLVADHQDLLTAPAQREAQARQQLREVAEMVRDQDPPVRGAIAVAVFLRLRDCLSRLERAAQDVPALVRVRDRLRAWRAELDLAHARALTAAIHRGPARRPEPVKRTGWNRPAP